VPVVVIANGDGPTVLMMAGIHGDEYEGQIALARLAAELTPDSIRGRVILMPMANPPAALAGRRVSPIDGGNLNRSFPGNPAGAPTDMIAHYLEHVVLPRCDYLVDLHSGGHSLIYPATLLRGPGADAEEAAKLRSLQDAFDLPWAWVFTSGGGRGSTARTAMGAGNRNGCVSIMAELGGGGGVSPGVLDRAERGLRRVLHSLGMLPGYRPDAARGTRPVHALGTVYAYDAGVLEPVHEIGDPVEKGQVVARIHTPDAPWRAAIEVASPHDGLVLARRALGRVARGDAICQIARDAD
jgi:Predicted deacylase